MPRLGPFRGVCGSVSPMRDSSWDGRRWKQLSRAVWVLGLVLVWSARLRAAATSAGLVLTHVTVIDAIGNTTRPDQSVVILDGRITANGPSSRIKLPKDARVIDAHGKFLIAGLWDMHVHI